MKLPSVELVNKVLDTTVILSLKLENTNVFRFESYAIEGRNTPAINVYEFAFSKCKEWAFKQGYIIESAHVDEGKFTSSYCKLESHFIYPKVKEVFHEATEVEAVFAACEYILEIKEHGNKND